MEADNGNGGGVLVLEACIELLRHASPKQLKIAYRFIVLLVCGTEDEKGG